MKANDTQAQLTVKEVRIGNYVYGLWDDEDIDGNDVIKQGLCTITGVDENGMLGEGWSYMLENLEESGTECYSGLFGIPIDEQWIINLGFEKNRDYKHPFAPIYFIEIRNEWICFLHNCTHRRIKYVHQLQNLFHAVTGGEELELKETLSK